MKAHKRLVALCLLTFCQLSFAKEESAESRVATVLERVKSLPEKVDLTVADLGMGALSVLAGSIVGHLGTCAIAHLLDHKSQLHPSYFSPSEWNIWLTAGTLTGAYLGGRIFLSSGLALTADNIDQALLAVVIASQPDRIIRTLDELYVSERFPRAAAFKELDKLRDNLSSLVKQLGELKEKKVKTEAKAIAAELLDFIAIVKTTMLAVKSDPRWFEECNAATLALTQANIQGYQNAHLATTAIQFAHSR